MKYKAEELKQVQMIEIEILKAVIEICEKHGLKYFTVGGTTLGAVRHSGFIPWDDDIDIGLLREDYESFLKIAPDELGDQYYLGHYTRDPNFSTYHAKVMKRGTIFLEEYAEKIEGDHGIFIDIMPFDNVPMQIGELKKYRRKVFVANQLFTAKSTGKTSLARGKKKIIYSFIRSCLHFFLLFYPKDKLYKKLDTEVRKHENNKTGLLSSRGLEVFECKMEDLIPTINHKFDDIVVQIPNNYDAILKKQYGDYMKLPPRKDRVGHSPKVLKL